MYCQEPCKGNNNIIRFPRVPELRLSRVYQHPLPQTPRTQVHSRSGGGSPLKPSQARGRQLCASTPGAASRSHRENGCSPWVQLNASGQRPPCSLRHTALKPLGDLPPTAEQPMGSPKAASLQVSFHYAGRAGVQERFFLPGGLLHKQGPRRARLRGAPLPYSHNALVATSCLCSPTGGPSEEPGDSPQHRGPTPVHFRRGTVRASW